MTLVVCEHHEDDDCLELTSGEIDIADGEIATAELHYECSEFELEGTYHGAGDVHTVSGALVLVEFRGTPLDKQRPIPGGKE